MITYLINNLSVIKCIYKEINKNIFYELIKKYDYIYLVSYNYIDLSFNNIDFSLNNIEYLKKITPIIDLKNSVDNIFKKFRTNTRRGINQTFKIENLKFINLDKNYKEIYELNKNFEYSHGWKPTIIDEFINGYTFSAYYNNKIIAIISCNIDNNIIRVTNIASNRLENNNEYNKIVGYATRRLVYEICKWGVENNSEFFDLGIINLLDPTKKGIASFKSSFGGEIVDTYIYRYKSKQFLNLKTNYHIH